MNVNVVPMAEGYLSAFECRSYDLYKPIRGDLWQLPYVRSRNGYKLYEEEDVIGLSVGEFKKLNPNVKHVNVDGVMDFCLSDKKECNESTYSSQLERLPNDILKIIGELVVSEDDMVTNVRNITNLRRTSKAFSVVYSHASEMISKRLENKDMTDFDSATEGHRGLYHAANPPISLLKFMRDDFASTKKLLQNPKELTLVDLRKFTKKVPYRKIYWSKLKKNDKIREIQSILGIREWKYAVSDANIRILLNYLFEARLKEIVLSRNLDLHSKEDIAYAKKMYDVAAI